MSKKKHTQSVKTSTLPLEIRGLILLFVSILAFISLISFNKQTFEDNWLGLAGYATAYCLQWGFGLGSYAILLFSGWTSLRLLKHKTISQYPLRCLYFSLLLFSLCLLLNWSAEVIPNFASWFQMSVYTQNITLQTSVTLQKTRYNLGGVPFYYIYKDLNFFNLHRILSNIGIFIVFSITFIVSYLQLTKWRLAFTLYNIMKNIFVKNESLIEEKEIKESSQNGLLSLLFGGKDSKNFFDTVITLPQEPLNKEKSIIASPLKRKLPLDTLPDTFKKEIPQKSELFIFNQSDQEKPHKVKENKNIDALKTALNKTSQAKIIEDRTESCANITPSYQLPNLGFLSEGKKSDASILKKDLTNQAKILEDTLLSFGIEAKVGQIWLGPTIASFEVHPAVGVKVQKIKTLENDIALNLQAKAIRILAPIPGKACVGVEIPSPKPQEVSFKELISNYLSQDKRHKIPVILGKSSIGEDVISDLTKMPHCIIAGATGSGKSVCINTIVMSILMTASPDEIKLLMVDPKKVELSTYNDLPHLIAPVITEAAQAAAALNWLVKEMEKRYEMLKQVGVRNIIAFNERIKDPSEPEDIADKLPYIVGIIDELADLMMVASQDIETPIARIAQMARAVGIHLILATQRPSREVITGLIKANFPTRIAFKVASRVNSQIILDDVGAESLLGNGDMLFLPPGTSTLIRAQGAFIRDDDINKVIKSITAKWPTNYLIKSFESKEFLDKSSSDTPPLDTLYGQAMIIVQDTGTASTTFLQRKLKIGYARAASLIDQLESNGIISAQEGAKPRKVLVFKDPSLPKRNLTVPDSEDF
jgi:S-DNA-T family DNA segregation ATPase FtsK/SpoIIIE